MTKKELAKKGTEKDFFKDLKGDLTHIKDFEEFIDDLPYLLGYIDCLEQYSRIHKAELRKAKKEIKELKGETK